MNKDEFLKLAVMLVGGSLPTNMTGSPQREKEIAVAVNVAYNALLDAYRHVPTQGTAETAW